MGNCKSISESDCSGGSTFFEPNADIAGIGTLIAFLFAATLTTAAIFVSYFKHWVPENVLSDPDRQFLRQRPKGPADSSSRLPRLTRGQHVEGASRFILALSDQQLVTGLSVTIAFLANRCRINLYELRLIYCFGWLSATIHLGTILILREYFYDHSLVRNLRLLAIAASLCLLCVTKAILTTGYWKRFEYHTPVGCIFKGQLRQPSFRASDILVEYFPLAYILTAYVSSIYALFEDPRDITRLPRAVEVFLRVETKFNKQRAKAMATGTTDLANSSVLYHFLLRHRKTWDYISGVDAMSAYRQSLLSRLPTLAFHFSYGVAQTLASRINGKVLQDYRMAFGQVSAVALLALPFLAIAELYNEAQVSATESERASEHHERVEEARSSPRQTLHGKDLADVVLRDIEEHLPPGANFDRRRCTITVLSFIHFIHTYQPTPTDRTSKRPWSRIKIPDFLLQSPIPLFFFFITTFQIAGAVPLGMAALDNSDKVSILAAVSLWRIWTIASTFQELRLRRRLLASQHFVAEKLAPLGDMANVEMTEDMIDLILASDNERTRANNGTRDTESVNRLVRDDTDEDSDLELPRRQDTEADIGLRTIYRH